MEKADVLKFSIKSAEFKDAVFILALDYPTISHHTSKTILHYGHNVYEKQMTASSFKICSLRTRLMYRHDTTISQHKIYFQCMNTKDKTYSNFTILCCSLPYSPLSFCIALIFKTNTAVRANSGWYIQIQLRVLTQGQCSYIMSSWYNEVLPIRLLFL